MSRLFERDYKIEINTNHGEILTYTPPMQIIFGVTNKPENNTSLASITIYGVSSRSRALINTFDDKKFNYGSVVLYAGYKDDLGIIFSGVINSLEITKIGVNTCVKMFCTNNGMILPNTLINKTWGDNTSALEILKDTAATFGLPVEVIGGFSDLPNYPRGLTVCQNSRDLLDIMRDDWRYSWWISNSRTIISRSGAAREHVIHKISASTGMEGVPRWYADQLEVDIKLTSKIQSGDVLDITSSFWTMNFSDAYFTNLQNRMALQQSSGKFNVLSTMQGGDFWHDEWKTTIICLWSAS